MKNKRFGSYTARARSDPSLEAGVRGDPQVISALRVEPPELFGSRGHPPEIRNSRDGPPDTNRIRGKPPVQKVSGNNSFYSELIFSIIGFKNWPNGRGMPGWEVSSKRHCERPQGVRQSVSRNVIATAGKQSLNQTDCFGLVSHPRNDDDRAWH